MFAGILQGLKELVYPGSCLTCHEKEPLDKEQNFICVNCLDKIERNLPPFCRSCGRHLDEASIRKNICAGCKNKIFFFDRAFSPCRYAGITKDLIHKFKYCQKDYLGEHLGRIMNSFIREYNLPIQLLDYIVPMPLHKSRLREREFNQAQVLSEIIAKEFDKPVLTGALIRDKASKSQTGLNFYQRSSNIKGSFRAAQPDIIKQSNLLLVDDVLTTAATSNEAAKCLKESGARIVILFTLAS